MEKATSQNGTEMFELARGQIKFDDVIGPHKQTNWELDFVRSGEGLHIFNGLTEPCVESELILVPNGGHAQLAVRSRIDRRRSCGHLHALFQLRRD